MMVDDVDDVNIGERCRVGVGRFTRPCVQSDWKCVLCVERQFREQRSASVANKHTVIIISFPSPTHSFIPG